MEVIQIYLSPVVASDVDLIVAGVQLSLMPQ
jgi:hypothetical protein